MSTVTLRPHQSTGVRSILYSALVQRDAGFLLADDVGLGKTFTAAVAMGKLLEYLRAEAAPDAPRPSLLVVCPLSVICHWEESLRRAGHDLARDGIRVVNYGKLRRYFLIETRKQGEKMVRAYTVREQPTLLIFDEAHAMKGYTSLAQKLGTRLMAGARYTLMLTATPAQTPLEVGYLQPILGFADYFAWLHRMAFRIGKHPKFRNLVWSQNDDDTRRIAELIYGRGRGLRRVSSELPGWPERQIEVFPVRLSTAEEQVYRRSLSDYLERRQQLRPGARELGPDELRLVEVGKLRESLSLLKVGHIAPLVLEQLEAGYQVAVFCLYRATALQLHGLLNAQTPTGLLTGSESNPRVREEVIQNFRHGRTKAIVFSVVEGINLEAPTPEAPFRIQINLDTPWSGIQSHQLNGRCHRNNMRALIYNVCALGTIDEHVARRVTERCRAIAQLAGDDGLRVLQEVTETSLERELAA